MIPTLLSTKYASVVLEKCDMSYSKIYCITNSRKNKCNLEKSYIHPKEQILLGQFFVKLSTTTKTTLKIFKHIMIYCTNFLFFLLAL